MRTLACADCGRMPKRESSREYGPQGQTEWTRRPGGRCWSCHDKHQQRPEEEREAKAQAQLEAARAANTTLRPCWTCRGDSARARHRRVRHQEGPPLRHPSGRLRDHQPLDLLPDRDADSVAAWLREHPGVEIVCCDRAQVFADGARAGAPNAQHCADKWHVGHNLGEAGERLVSRHRAVLRDLVGPTPGRLGVPARSSRTGCSGCAGCAAPAPVLVGRGMRAGMARVRRACSVRVAWPALLRRWRSSSAWARSASCCS
ncbi:transposase [Kitasatospora sp. NPDC017646]|uniref:transposase n=1 Tax=Kitasatospora sp. NPDC017646 TaxID=3364024 RepID=UPI00378E3DE2